MSFTNLALTSIVDGGYAYLAYDLEHGFRLLEEKVDLNAVYFRDLADSDADGINDTPLSTSAIIVNSKLVDFEGDLESLLNSTGSLIKVGDTWTRILAYNESGSISIDNFPARLPAIQRISIANPGVITMPGHGMANDTPIQFASLGLLPAPLTSGTTYYTRNVTDDTFTISTIPEEEGTSIIAITEQGFGQIFCSLLYSVFTTTFDADKINDTIIGKIYRQGSTYTMESYYNVSGSSVTPLELVNSLPVAGDYEGQVVLNTLDNTIYTWNGVAWATGAGEAARSVSLSTTAQAFSYDSFGNITGTSSATITATPFNATGSVTYGFKVDGALPYAQEGINAVFNYTAKSLLSDMPDVIQVDMFDDNTLVASDFVTLFGVKEGADAITIVVSNEAHTVPSAADGSATILTGSGTTVQVYKGATPLPYDDTSPYTSPSFRVSISGSNVTTGVVTGSGFIATIPDHTAMGSGSTGFVTITVTVTDGGQSTTYTKIQSLTKSLAGAAAAIFSIDNSAVTFIKGENGVVEPSAGIQLTTSSTNFTIASYQWQKNGTNISGATSSTYTVPTADYASAVTNTYTCTATGTINGVAGQTRSDSITIPRLDVGSSSPTVVLSNENITFAAAATGFPTTLTSGVCNITAFIGTTSLTYDNTVPYAANSFRATIGAQSGIAVTLSAAGSTLTVTPNTISTDTAFVDINIIITDAAGVVLSTIVKRITYSLSRAGRDVEVYTGATAPTTPETGDIWYNGDVAFYYNGSEWVQIVNAPTGTRTLSALSEDGIYIGEIAFFSGDYYVWDGNDWLLAIDGVTLVLSNQTHTLPANSSGVPTSYVGAQTSVYVYASGIDDTSNWTLSAAPTYVTGSFTGNVYTVTNLSQPVGYVDITATKGSRTKTSRFSLSTSSAGTNGTAIRLRPNVPVVKQNTSGGRVPGTIIFKAENVSSSGVTTYTGDIKIESGTDGVNFPNNRGTVNGTQSSLNVSALTDTFFKGTLYVTGTSTVIDEQIVSVISDGLDGNSGGTVSRLDLSNESHSVPASFDGTVLSFDGASTDLRVYKGQAIDTGWTFSEISETNVIGSFPGGASSSTANPSVFTVTSWTSIADDVAYVDFEATKTGEATLYGTFSLTRVRGGEDGTDPTVYRLVLSTDSVVKNSSGVFSPTPVTFSAVSVTGNALPVAYTGGQIRYQIDTGSGFGSETVGTSYTPSGNVKNIKVNLYSGSTLLDSETIPVVSDGLNGATGATGATGSQARIAYIIRTSNFNFADGQTERSIAGDNLPSTAWWNVGAGTSWSKTPPSPIPTGSSLYQVTGLYDGTNTVWQGYPYLSALKVGQLSAITADLGTITTGIVRNSAGTFGINAILGVIVNFTGSYMKIVGSGFGASSDLIEWFGPTPSGATISDPKLSTLTKTNGIWAQASDGKVYYGSAELLTGSGAFSLSITGTRLRNYLSPTTLNWGDIVATVSNGSGSYTYQWTLVSGDNMNITLANTAEPNFSKAVSAGDYQGTYELLVTDNSTGSVLLGRIIIAAIYLG